MTIDAAVHYKPGGNDAVEASGIGKRSNVQRQLEGAWYLECFDLGVAIDPLKKPDASLVDDVVVPAGLDEGDAMHAVERNSSSYVEVK